MKVTLDLPDGTTVLGLFINYKRNPDTKPSLITTTNWLTQPEDGKVITLDPKGAKITERKD